MIRIAALRTLTLALHVSIICAIRAAGAAEPDGASGYVMHPELADRLVKRYPFLADKHGFDDIPLQPVPECMTAGILASRFLTPVIFPTLPDNVAPNRYYIYTVYCDSRPPKKCHYLQVIAAGIGGAFALFGPLELD